MITVAIISAGASVHETWPEAVCAGLHFDHEIAVNAAALTYESDYIAAGDYAVYRERKWGRVHRPRKGIISMAACIRRLRRGVFDSDAQPWSDWLADDMGAWDWKSASTFVGTGHVCQTSMPAALAFACEVLRADLVHVYGHDATGIGIAPSAWRYAEQRWIDERRAIEHICHTYPRVRVRFIAPASTQKGD